MYLYHVMALYFVTSIDSVVLFDQPTFEFAIVYHITYLHLVLEPTKVHKLHKRTLLLHC